MESWKKSLLIGLFSSMLLEQQVVEAAVGLNRPSGGVALAEAPPAKVAEQSLDATEHEKWLLEQIRRDRVKRFARYMPRFDSLQDGTPNEGVASRAILDAQEVHAAVQPAVKPLSAPAPSQWEARAQVATRGDAQILPTAQQPAKQRQVVTVNYGSNAAPTLNQSAGVTATRGNRIATHALRYQGVTYVYGGETPQGFDCSGFIQYVMREAGLDVPRTTYAQYEAGAQVAKQNLQPGDLVFFACGGAATSHAGIYLGNGKFVHADGTDGVTVDDLNSGYWAGVYQAGVRVT